MNYEKYALVLSRTSHKLPIGTQPKKNTKLFQYCTFDNCFGQL